MPNLIQQQPRYRPQPQNPAAFAAVVDVDPVVATWAGIWQQQAQSFKALEPGRAHINKNRVRVGDAVGPSIIPTPPFTWWQPVVDANVAKTMIAPIYQERSSFKAWEPGRFHINALRKRVGDAVGPSVIDSPSIAWFSWFMSTQVAFDTTVMTPIYELPIDYVSPKRRQIDTRQINQPDTDWQYPVNDAVVATLVGAFDTHTKRYLSPKRRVINVASINEPEFTWSYPVVDADVAKTIIPAILAMPSKYRTRNATAILVQEINRSQIDWIFSNLPAIFDPITFTGVYNPASRSFRPVGYPGISSNLPNLGWINTILGGIGINPGDEVEVLLAPNGIPCTVLVDSGTSVRVVISSATQIHVLIEGGTPIKVII